MGDDVIGREVFVNGSFDIEKLITAKKLITKQKGASNIPKNILDIGANIGTIAIPAISSGMFEKAICIEPIPKNFRILKANVILNNLEHKVNSINTALGSKDNEELDMILSKNNHGDNRVSCNYTNEIRSNIIKVKSKTLDSVMNKEDYDCKDFLVWMDVQGYEGWVMQGATSFLESKVPMVLEFWPWGMDKTSGYKIFKESLKNYSGFYDLNNPENFHPVNKFDELYLSVGFGEELFTDILVI